MSTKEEMFGSERNIGKTPESLEEFIKVTMGRVAFTMHDPIIRKTRMFLVQERKDLRDYCQTSAGRDTEDVCENYKKDDG